MAETMENNASPSNVKSCRPSEAQSRYLMRGLKEPGGKLPLFDANGQRIKEQTIRSCISHGWCELWFKNPIKPAWLVCKLTEEGRRALRGNKH